MSEKLHTPTYEELMSPLQELRNRLESQAGPIGLRVAAQEIELRAEAEVDEITGLRNHKGLMSELEKLINSDDENKNFAIVFVDLDGFKAVNYIHGHVAGDNVLKNVGKFFKEASQPKKSEDDKSFKFRSVDDEAFRLGGDEFVILIKTKNTQNGERKQDRTEYEFIEGFNARLSEGIKNSGKNVEQTIDVDGSYGYAIHQHGESVNDFITRADSEMYKEKILKKDKDSSQISAEKLLKDAINELDDLYEKMFDEKNTPFSEKLDTYKKVTIEGKEYTIKNTNNLASYFFVWAKQQTEFKEYFDYENEYYADKHKPSELINEVFSKFVKKYPKMVEALLPTNPQSKAALQGKENYRMLFANALFDAVASDVWDAGMSPIELTV
jgi:diguanylate cyclase (GGDEF)-like protein